MWAACREGQQHKFGQLAMEVVQHAGWKQRCTQALPSQATTPACQVRFLGLTTSGEAELQKRKTMGTMAMKIVGMASQWWAAASKNSSDCTKLRPGCRGRSSVGTGAGRTGKGVCKVLRMRACGRAAATEIRIGWQVHSFV